MALDGSDAFDYTYDTSVNIVPQLGVFIVDIPHQMIPIVIMWILIHNDNTRFTPVKGQSIPHPRTLLVDESTPITPARIFDGYCLGPGFHLRGPAVVGASFSSFLKNMGAGDDKTICLARSIASLTSSP